MNSGSEFIEVYEPINPLKAKEGIKLALMGNEAIARGAIEGGVYVVTGYPGTPSSEVLMTIQEFGKDLDMYAEWAVNERVAFEIAYGASIGGARSLVTMKAPGINVASDPVLSSAYGGVDGGLLILVADDPGPHTTQTEQDSRWFALLSKLPMITPSSPQEAKDFTVIGLDLSEDLNLPVILRTTTRVNHTVGDVILGPIRKPKKYVKIVRDPERFVRAGMKWNLKRHKWLNERLKKVEQLSFRYKLNKVLGDGSTCIITEGSAYNYVIESLERLKLSSKVKVIKLGLIHPIPKDFLSKELITCEKVVIIEELDPFIEHMIKNVLYDLDLRIKVYGKQEGILPLEGELNTSLVLKAIAKATGVEIKYLIREKAYDVPPRPPPLCPSCPHRSTYLAIIFGIARAGFKRDEVPIFGDIGCYALSVYPPLNAIWTEHSMGASISMAMGLKVSGYDKPVVATIGDSTFYHAGIQPLIEAVHKRINMLVVILDNSVVAMTGHQSTPAWSKTETGRSSRSISIENIVRSIGVDNLAIIDSYDIDTLINKVTEFLKKPGVNVIIAKHPCALMEARLKGVAKKYKVIPEKCTSCMACIRVTGCPALYVDDDGKIKIMIEDCLGCGLCAKYCPYNAIVEVK